MNKKTNNKKLENGFTLIEILVVMGLIALLAAVVLVAVNPARQFAQGRNTQRMSNVNAILNAIGQNIADNKGVFTCTAPGAVIDDTVRKIAYTATAAAGLSDLRPCIVPAYMAEIPFDPGISGAHVSPTAPTTDYNTEYTIAKDATTQRLTVCAPGGAEVAIPGSTAICITR